MWAGSAAWFGPTAGPGGRTAVCAEGIAVVLAGGRGARAGVSTDAALRRLCSPRKHGMQRPLAKPLPFAANESARSPSSPQLEQIPNVRLEIGSVAWAVDEVVGFGGAS